MAYKCILSAGNKPALEKMINDYFYSSNYIITSDLKVYNTKTEKTLNYIVTCKGGRWAMKKEI